ncbi:OmpA family protein [Hymenobacter sp. BT175]|uniref:PA14 domain-containing protein n=1 Tax=Hymenobacter translucens TaxID=2886507 RepID=UPI001D0EB65E|nr:PA14 domain-containing protein [Hymenobacter translucens]MCC2545546.1 OmpA family protein [Hymenobacter translucens]
MLLRYCPGLLLLLLFSTPAWSQAPAAPGGGIQGAYFAGENFERMVFVRTDAVIDFNWDNTAPGPGMPVQSYSVRWTGYLLAPVSGEYRFSTVMDDGLRFWLGHKQLINSWRPQDHVPASVSIRLEAGRYYPIRIEYFQQAIEARAVLLWQRPDAPAREEVVPTRHLFVQLPPTARPIPVAPPVKPPVASPVIAANPKPAPVRAAVPVRPQETGRRPPVRRPAPAQPATMAEPRVGSELSELGSLAKGSTVVLEHLYFEQGVARMLPSSLPELDKLAQLLKSQPALQLEIVGHTDNVGDPALNLQLSRQRAERVRDYLLRNGVEAHRLVAEGYGGTRPVADNDDPRQRPRNRRVEVVVR